MYMHEKEYELRYTDADVFDHLKLSSLLGVMQESACLSADELKFGYNDIKEKNVAFVVANWVVRLFRQIDTSEKLTVKTWPIKPKHLLIFRDFELYVGEEKVGVASSRWCLVDLKTFSMLPATAVFANDEREYNAFRSIDSVNWKIPEIQCGEKRYSKTVSYSDYDHYNHLTNTKYAELALDVFSVEEMRNRVISCLQISYVKQCKYGETIDFYREINGNVCLIEGRVGNELRVQVKVEFDD